MRANFLTASAIVAVLVSGAFAQSDQPGAAPPAQPGGQVQATQPQPQPGQAQPEVDHAAFGDPEAYEQRRQEIDRFWQQHAG